MKMKHIFRTFAMALAFCSIVSCNLDLYPDTSIPYDKDVPMIQTGDDITGFHRGIYADFRSCQAGTYKIADDVMFDAFNATQNFGNRYGAIHRLDGSFTSGDDYITSFWAALYGAINDYNIIIEQIPISTVDKEVYGDDLALMEADAKTARAWSYLQLARRYGKVYNPGTASTDLCVPLVLVYDQSARPSRATVEAVYGQIKKDLDEAWTVLETKTGKAKSTEFTADVLHCLYANYYLDIQEYGEAYNHANAVIGNSAYQLCSTEAEFKAEWFEDGGKEAVMLLPTSLQELVGGYGEYMNYNSDKNSPTRDAYTGGFIPSRILVDAYETKDFRYRNWLDDTSKIPYGCNGNFYQGKFFVFAKYKGNTALSSGGVHDGHIAPKPFALPEMYLIAAEAAFKDKQTLKALSALTTLQSKRNATPSTTVTMEEIQKEWFRETVGEGLRLECLKRWNVGTDAREGQTGALEANVLMETAGYVNRDFKSGDYHLCWPIPSYEIKVNANLASQQNDGYSSSTEE